MKPSIAFRSICVELKNDAAQRLSIFALLNLGMVQSLASGVLSVKDVIPLFYNADNCLYVRKQLSNKHAEAIMSRGGQLPDLFEHLPAGTAYRECTHELEAIRAHGLTLLNKTRSATRREKRARAF